MIVAMKKILICLILALSINSIYSQNNIDDIKIHLVTFGPGDELYFRWGHFGVIVDYPDRKDQLYDYGNFNFKQDKFFSNFIKSVLNYSKEKISADLVIDLYRRFNRSITLQELDLTNKQKITFIEKLENDVKPGNNLYLYDHYYNNCVSEVIDYLDELTEGDYYRGASKRIGRSFRDLSRDYVNSHYLYNILISFLLGSKVDYNITIKESLFLPEYAANWADQVILRDESGERPLVKNKIEIYKSKGRDEVIPNAKPRVFLSLLIGIALALVTFLLSRTIKKYVFEIILGGILGIAGSILFFMSFFTGHYYIHNNWNLIFINPLSFLIMVGGIIQIRDRHRAIGHGIVQKYIDVTLLITVVMIVLKTGGLIVQGNSEIIALALPILIANSSFKTLLPNITQVGWSSSDQDHLNL